MKALATLWLFLLLLPLPSIAQNRLVTGIVRDATTRSALQFANIRVDGTDLGTTTDKQGRFTLHLSEGEHSIIASFIGYTNIRRTIRVGTENPELQLALTPVDVKLADFVVTPGDNPALAIIRKAIEQREKRKDLLQSYSFSSHSKLVTEVAGDLVQSATKDSAVTGILESQTDAFWAKPDYYKEIVKARKQSAFIPADANVMISAFFIADFSRDQMIINKKTITGPISERGLKEYSYRLAGSTMMDDQTIHMIEISPWDEADPLWKGTIYIAEGTYALMMVDLELTKPGLPTFFRQLAFKQHFRLFDQKFWMPVDVVVNADIGISMIIDLDVKVDGFSVLQNYRFNQPISDDFFDKVVIKVLKEADLRDSTWWAEHQAIPNTAEEVHAYLKADSVKMVLEEKRNEYGVSNVLTGKNFGWDDTYLSVPGLLNLYHFNRVEGHALQVPITIRLDRDPDHVLALEGGRGFSDKKWKYDTRLTLGLSRELNARFTFGFSDKLEWLDGGPAVWGELPATLSNWLWKYDYRDFYARRQIRASLYFEPIPETRIQISADRNDDASVEKNTDWSLVSSSRQHRQNPPVNQGRLFNARISLRYDSRDFIDNAGKIQRMGGPRLFDPQIGFGYHHADLGGQTHEWLSATATVQGEMQLGTWGNFTWRMQGDIAGGSLPTQSLYMIHGSPEYFFSTSRFQTLDFREFGGDRRIVGRLAHDFDDVLWRRLGIPLLKSSGFGLSVFLQGAWTSMSPGTIALQTVETSSALVPFYESGFRLRMFNFIDVSCAWRLNHFRDGRNMAIGISAALLGGGGNSFSIGL